MLYSSTNLAELYGILFFFGSTIVYKAFSSRDRLLPVVCLFVCLTFDVWRLSDFYIFDFFSRTTGPIVINVGTNHPEVKGIQNCSYMYDGCLLSSREDNSERVKIHWFFLKKKKKIFFSRTSKSNFNQTGTNHPLVRGILNCSN
jgi:hypothetical protein